ncbi:RNA polymerase, sigma-24 subunit, ECF subfamily (plasmid) [Streptantibioticus cattleyicolor NRRL 8057 = DSM 46488]|uniref:RNA polymerase, sigma-24 subunit, ECF subfamily n=1 Tax=Streptantibioticus cattleyicolor (strain ATCC 35852 / DSM 46488 / JCM 4925 / NBRC 14057 / NRRL 8057) TaxID=1003195 RepID=G8XE53_STREN|nr:RNA polymerase, sigma-24 subunit, ECF subfamily [Streptantibioticus cattleyicolor NRRL 8057 = DSM 46488]
MTRDRDDVIEQLEPYRRELTGYCYRMLGSAFEAEDAVQETLVRAWSKFAGFEGRSALRTWLYRIATNVCLDMAPAAQRRARPMDLFSPGSATAPDLARLEERIWVGPVPDERVLRGDPAEVAVERETIRLAFVSALQRLPARQRAVLVLREVLAWSAAETAELLETTVASVNSALQRARATLAEGKVPASDPAEPLDEGQRALLARYVSAFEAFDIDALTALLHEDAVLNMPPYRLWLRGIDQLRAWWLGTGSGCRGSRLVPVRANGTPAFAQYRPAEDGDGWTPWGITVLEITDGRIDVMTNHMDTERLFPLWNLPTRLTADAAGV